MGGILNAEFNTEYRIEFFSNILADPTGYGEGQTYLGFTTVTTDGAGNGSFSAILNTAVAIGDFISATATDPNGNTSEFAQVLQVTGAAEVEVKLGDTTIVDDSTTPISFGVADEGGVTQELTFLINNLGGQTLSVGTVSLNNNTGFEVVEQPSSSVPAEGSTTFSVRMLTTNPGNKSADVRFSDGDENPFNFRIAGTVIATTLAEIDVEFDGNNNVHSHTFAVVTVGQSRSAIFTVRNEGTATLTVSQANGLNSPFTITPPNGTGSGDDWTIAPSATRQFTVTFLPTAATAYSDTLILINSDGDESNYQISLTGTGIAAGPAVPIIDDGEADFSTGGSWSPRTFGANGDSRLASAGDGSAVASWTFTGLVAGQYRVSATWAAHNNRATDSPFTIYDGATERGTVDVDQQLVPSGSPELTDLGAAWHDLAGPYNITGDTLVVRLTNDANQFVIADAIRIERIS